MTVLTGADGAFRYNGAIVAKVRSWTLNVTKDALETTNLSARDRTYIPGLRGSTGTADVLYDESDGATKSLFNQIFEDGDSSANQVEFVLNAGKSTSLRGNCFVSSLGASVSVGDVQAMSVSLQCTGSISGKF